MGSAIVAIIPGGILPSIPGLPEGADLVLLDSPVLIEDPEMKISVETIETPKPSKVLNGKIRERDDRGRLVFLQRDGSRRSPFDRPYNHKRRKR